MSKRKIHISERAKRLNNNLFIDVHNHMMFEYAIREALGEKNIFNQHYLPVLNDGCINVIGTTVGSNSPCVCNMTDYLEFGCFEQIDMLKRAEKESGTFCIVHNVDEIIETYKKGKIGVLLTFEGARAMEGRPGEESLVMLRTFYELGLRINCISGSARNRFSDAVGEMRANAGITTFGIKLVEEMNKLGMLIDLTHLHYRCFMDYVETSIKPIIVSHIGVKALSPNDCNLNDEQIKAVAANNGVICMEMVKTDIKLGSQETGERVTFDTVVDHLDHIVDLVGPDHIGIGLDFDNFDLVHNVHRAMSPYPGTIEGFHTGIPKGDHMLDEPNTLGEAYVIAEYLVKRGYSDNNILKILGGNLIRLFQDTLQ